jgi:hypothetical protein
MKRLSVLGASVLSCLLLGTHATPAMAGSADPFARGCPSKVLDEGATEKLNHNPAARKAIVPAGAISVRICDYYGFGFGKQTPKTQARAGDLQDGTDRKSRDLLESLTLEFQELEAAPEGPVHCPADEGAQLYVVFSYRSAAPVFLSVSLSGCEFVSGAAPRGRHLDPSLRNRLLNLVEGHQGKASGGGEVHEKRAVAYPPPHLTFAKARHGAKDELERSCESSKLCSSQAIGRCARKNAKSIGCRYSAEDPSGEVCRGTITVTNIGEGTLLESPGVQREEEGECSFIFAPPGLKERFEREEAEEAEGERPKR